MLDEQLVDLIRPRFALDDAGPDQGVSVQIVRMAQAELVFYERVHLPGGDIVLLSSARRGKHIAHNAAERDPPRGSHGREGWKMTWKPISADWISRWRGSCQAVRTWSAENSSAHL